jgi:hypothetical protein
MVKGDDALAIDDEFGATQTFELLDLMSTPLNLAGRVLVAEKECVVGDTRRHTEHQTDVYVSKAALAHACFGVMSKAKVMHRRSP